MFTRAWGRRADDGLRVGFGVGVVGAVAATEGAIVLADGAAVGGERRLSARHDLPPELGGVGNLNCMMVAPVKLDKGGVVAVLQVGIFYKNLFYFCCLFKEEKIEQVYLGATPSADCL